MLQTCCYSSNWVQQYPWQVVPCCVKLQTAVIECSSIHDMLFQQKLTNVEHLVEKGSINDMLYHAAWGCRHVVIAAIECSSIRPSSSAGCRDISDLLLFHEHKRRLPWHLRKFYNKARANIWFVDQIFLSAIKLLRNRWSAIMKDLVVGEVLLWRI